MASKLITDSKILSSKLVLCDIEGTTTSISFVKETLFPFALKNVESFLKDTWDTETTKTVIEEIYLQSVEDVDKKIDGAVIVLKKDSDKTEQIESIVKSVEWMMSCDRKVGPLKNLQGLIWENGYKNGSIKGHVYEDVPKALENWITTGHKIYIYSSGSVPAQKLLFENSEHGNLLEHLSGHFDTKIGLKQDKESYVKIIKEVDAKPDEILFLTDIVKEAEAAKLAGMNVCLLDRPGNASFTEKEKEEYIIITSFADIPLESIIPAKRKIEDIAEDRPSKIAKTEENGKDEKEVEKKEDKTNGADEDVKSITEKDTNSKKEEESMDIDMEPNIETDNELIKKTDSQIKTESKIEEKKQKTDEKNDAAELMEVDGADLIKDKCANLEKEKNDEIKTKEKEIEKAEKEVNDEKLDAEKVVVVVEENIKEKDVKIVNDEKKEDDKIEKETKDETVTKVPEVIETEKETKKDSEKMVTETENLKEDIVTTPEIVAKEEIKKIVEAIEEKTDEVVIPEKKDEVITVEEKKIDNNKKEEEMAVCSSPVKTKTLPEDEIITEKKTEPTEISELAAIPETTEVKIPTEDNAKSTEEITNETEVLDKKNIETVESPNAKDEKEKIEQISTENKIEITVTPAEIPATVTSTTTSTTSTSNNTAVTTTTNTNDKETSEKSNVVADNEEKEVKEKIETSVETNGVETNGKSDEKLPVEKNGNDSDKENNDKEKNGDVKDDVKETSNSVTEIMVKKCKDVPSPLPTSTTPVESET